MNYRAYLIAVGMIILALSTFSFITLGNLKTIDARSEFKVQAGGGNSSGPLTVFIPQKLEVKVGDSITWYNPSTVPEPHNTAFIFDKKSAAEVLAPFLVQNTTQFEPQVPPGPNSQPFIVPFGNGTNVVMALNSRVYSPTVIDSLGKLQIMNPNANYTITGDEKYVNSGFLLPKGIDRAFPESSNTFTATFQKTGTYNYVCLVHPWMLGSVVVK